MPKNANRNGKNHPLQMVGCLNLRPDPTGIIHTRQNQEKLRFLFIQKNCQKALKIPS